MKKLFFILLVLTNSAFAENNNFSYQNKPINPACVALFNSSEADKPYIKSIDLSACQNSNVAYQKTLSDAPSTYYFYINNKNIDQGKYSYTVLGKSKDGIYAIKTLNNTGGTLTAVDLLFIQLANNEMKLIRYTPFTSTQGNIQNLNTVLEKVRKITQNNAINFPENIPASNASIKLYANLDKYNNTGYVINIDATPDCQGAKYCNIGNLVIQPNQVKSNDKKIRYTKASVGADYWPTTLQWHDGQILYTLSWRDADKNSLLLIANSTIKQA